MDDSDVQGGGCGQMTSRQRRRMVNGFKRQVQPDVARAIANVVATVAAGPLTEDARADFDAIAEQLRAIGLDLERILAYS